MSGGKSHPGQAPSPQSNNRRRLKHTVRDSKHQRLVCCIHLPAPICETRMLFVAGLGHSSAVAPSIFWTADVATPVDEAVSVSASVQQEMQPAASTSAPSAPSGVPTRESMPVRETPQASHGARFTQAVSMQLSVCRICRASCNSAAHQNHAGIHLAVSPSRVLLCAAKARPHAFHWSYVC